MTEQRYGGPEGKCGICQQFKNACRCADKLDIAAIRARAEAATPGPWRAMSGGAYVEQAVGVGDLVVADNLEEGSDGHFIAAARTDVPALCDALEAAGREMRDAQTTWRTGQASCCYINQQRAEAAEAKWRSAAVECMRFSDLWSYAKDGTIPDLEARAEAAEARVKELEESCATNAHAIVELRAREQRAEARVKELEAQLIGRGAGDDAYIIELEAQLATARDDALEEAAALMDQRFSSAGQFGAPIRALKGAKG